MFNCPPYNSPRKAVKQQYLIMGFSRTDKKPTFTLKSGQQLSHTNSFFLDLDSKCYGQARLSSFYPKKKFYIILIWFILISSLFLNGSSNLGAQLAPLARIYIFIFLHYFYRPISVQQKSNSNGFCLIASTQRR
jgi:hypothetical protein